MLQSIRQQIWKTQQWPQDKNRSVFIPISKKGNAKEYSNYQIIALISHASKVMFKILEARLQQYMNWELPNVQTRFRKGRGTGGQIANIHWILEKTRGLPPPKKKSTSASLITLKPLIVWITTNWKILKELGTLDYLTCLLWNLFGGQEATVRTRHKILDWFKIGKGVWQACILSLHLFNLCAEYIMRDAGMKHS